MRFAVDTGGTFTDLVVADQDGAHLYKAPTTPEDPVRGILDVLAIAAQARAVALEELLARGSMLLHGTTRAVNAIVTGSTAKTAFLTTAGHPDVLVFREGGRSNPFDHARGYPEPYVSRALTFEVPERIGSQGEIIRPLDEPATLAIIGRLREQSIEAVGVCLLWSTVNPAHEQRVGKMLAEHLPEVPFTLSSEVNPTLREYRRASAAVIDASLKPLMTEYLRGLERRLRQAGFAGRMLMFTSSGGVLELEKVAHEPIHSINSGPAMAPVAGKYFAQLECDADTVVVADTGGTTYDVSLVRKGRLPMTRETWIGPQYFGHMTGFPSAEIKTIGAGGGSVAWVDDGGLLHVGPRSAGAVPGPAAYGRGGIEPTVTDASLVLGHIDPDYFLGGRMELDVDAAYHAISDHVARPLGLDVDAAASAVLALATDQMVMAIKQITINQGIDPSEAVLVGGGGAAGLNSVAIAMALRSPALIIPDVGAALSAAGGLMSDLAVDYATTFVTTTAAFDAVGANEHFCRLEERCRGFIDQAGATLAEARISYSVEARYARQVWELEVPLQAGKFRDADAVELLRRTFDDLHEDVFGVRQPEESVEILALRTRVACRLQGAEPVGLYRVQVETHPRTQRSVYFPSMGRVPADVVNFDAMPPGEIVEGPAIIESRFTTVVVDPGNWAERRESGSLIVHIGRPGDEASIVDHHLTGERT